MQTRTLLASHIEQLLRELAPQVLGAVVRRFRDFPGFGGCRTRGLDRRCDAVARRNCETAVIDEAPLVVAPALYSEPQFDPDDTLVLLFRCCHPALTPASAIALTLRAVGGLSTVRVRRRGCAVSHGGCEDHELAGAQLSDAAGCAPVLTSRQ